VLPVRAAGFAFDNAAQPAYDDGWQTGDNGGTGWGGGWTFETGATGQGGSFVWTSTQNGFGSDPGNDGDIDTGGRAWGLWWSGGQTLQSAFIAAERPFDGALSVGQTFRIDLDNGLVAYHYRDANGWVGFSLIHADGSAGFSFSFWGGNQYYGVNDFIPPGNTTVPFTDQGLRLEFTLTSAESFSLTIDGIGNDGPAGLPVTCTGSIFGELVGVRVFHHNAGFGSAADSFTNNIAIIPEPSTAVLVVLALAAFPLARATFSVRP